jgi:beta-galactosidase GanA
MYFGTQYYRPPFPYKEYWRRDIEHIRKLNFNVVKLWAVWNWIEPVPNQFDFSELDELVGICRKNGLKVIINTIPEGAPYWTAKGFEDSFYKTADGEILYYSGAANLPSAGWPGLCPDSEEALRLMCNFIYEVCKHYSGDDTVFCIDVWNEPHLEPMFDYSNRLLCYCSHSQEKFRKWLKEKYFSLDNLNNAWFRKYVSWDQVEAPRRFGTAADMMDWRRFWLYNLADWLKCRVDAARKGSPGKLVQTHVAFSGYMGIANEGGLANELGDEYLLAREVDMFGLSTFPLWLMGDNHPEGHFINTEIVAEASREKPFYQVELQGGAGKSGLLGGLVPTDWDIRQWNLNVIAAGGKGVVYWQFAPEPAGLESPGFGLVNPDGSDTLRSLTAGDCAKRFNLKNLTDSRRCLSENAVFLSRNSDLLTFAMKEEDKYNQSFVGISAALLDRGIPYRFIHGDYIDSVTQEGVKTLYVPMGLCLSDAEKDGLVQFAEAGGTLVVECCTGMYRENGEMDDNFSFLYRLFGMTGNRIDAIKKKHTHAHCVHCGKSLKLMYYRQLFDTCDQDCKVTAVFDDGCPAVIEKAAGEGKAVWIGGFAGAEYKVSRDQNTGDFIASYFNPKGYPFVEELSCSGMTVRFLEDTGAYYAVCINRRDIPLPISINVGGHNITAEIPAGDGEILQFKK